MEDPNNSASVNSFLPQRQQLKAKPADRNYSVY